MINYGEWDEVNLKKLRIHELRDLARKIGVKSPTSQNKDELIEKVLKIISGEVAPYVAKTGKGRPTRAASQLNNLVDYFLPENINKDLSDSKDFLEFNKFDFFASMPENEFDNFVSQDQITVEGYLDVTTSGYGIIRVNGFDASDDDVYVHKIYVAKHGLQSGDYVKANAKSIYSNRPKAVTSILEINKGKARSQIKFDDIKRVESNDSFKLYGNNIKFGTLNVVLTDDKVMFDNTKNIIKNIKTNKDPFYIVIAPTKGDEKFEQVDDNCILVPFNVTKNYFNVYSNLKLALVKAKDFAEQNDVIFIMSGLNHYFRALMVLMSENEQNVFKLDEMVKLELTKILLSAKATLTSSLSIILFESTKLEQKILDFVKYDIGNIADNEFKFENNTLKAL